MAGVTNRQVVSGVTVTSVTRAYHVSNGDTLIGATVTGGSLIIDQGGVASNVVVSSTDKNAAPLLVQPGGTLYNLEVYSTAAAGAGNPNIYGVVDGGIIHTNASMTIMGDGQVSNVIVDGGTLGNYTGSSFDIVLNNNGRHIIQGGLAVRTIINSGNQIVRSTTVAISTQIYNGFQTVAGTASNTTVHNMGSQLVTSGGMAYDTIIENGGYMNVASGGHMGGTIQLQEGGRLTTHPTAGGAVDLQGNNNSGLIISGINTTTSNSNTTITTTISGYSGDKEGTGETDLITLYGVKQSDVVSVDFVDAQGNPSGDYVTLKLKNGSKLTMHILGVEDQGYALGTDSNGNLTMEVCFLEGTMIKTPNGDIAIETLSVGDLVTTFDWKNNQIVTAPIKWIGKKTTFVKSSHPDDEAGYPVRILKDAISEGVPYKDLLVTAEHCLFFDGKFVPARMLINGMSIFYDYSFTEYTYYHLETDKHSVIYADGMLTESYLDTGNRYNFIQDGSVFILRKNIVVKTWENDAAAELNVQRMVVEPIYNQIFQRCLKKDQFHYKEQHLTNDSNICLKTKKHNILPYLVKGNIFFFQVDENIDCVNILSNADRPCDVIGPYVDDRRRLGVLIGKITVITPKRVHDIKIHIQHDILSGWHSIESCLYRWTDGNALLPFEEKIHGKKIIMIEVVAGGPYKKNKMVA
ncbi:Hint domain-containing protein [Commensalibacter oyaizuii]|uniref:Hint domain-containing protein n=1 Tax=Commensalibacter oyaizuii TaxID=3043873 RepID=A0ABT6Q144_9PROT|nr:Hint domain-containing protein [Commensalibacter sp. TBRC 16381]MDI2090827.1 Hint domain-containing protein [Commensalibacter sp. TBRC 16381]